VLSNHWHSWDERKDRQRGKVGGNEIGLLDGNAAGREARARTMKKSLHLSDLEKQPRAIVTV